MVLSNNHSAFLNVSARCDAFAFSERQQGLNSWRCYSNACHVTSNVISDQHRASCGSLQNLTLSFCREIASCRHFLTGRNLYLWNQRHIRVTTPILFRIFAEKSSSEDGEKESVPDARLLSVSGVEDALVGISPDDIALAMELYEYGTYPDVYGLEEQMAEGPPGTHKEQYLRPPGAVRFAMDGDEFPTLASLRANQQHVILDLINDCPPKIFTTAEAFVGKARAEFEEQRKHLPYHMSRNITWNIEDLEVPLKTTRYNFPQNVHEVGDATVRGFTELHWKDRLVPEQYKVLRERKFDEEAGSGYFWNFTHRQKGRYVCSGCFIGLFRHEQKYLTEDGYATFFAPSAANNVREVESAEVVSAEGVQGWQMECGHCGGFVGHVFPDGPHTREDVQRRRQRPEDRTYDPMTDQEQEQEQEEESGRVSSQTPSPSPFSSANASFEWEPIGDIMPTGKRYRIASVAFLFVPDENEGVDKKRLTASERAAYEDRMRNLPIQYTDTNAEDTIAALAAVEERERESMAEEEELVDVDADIEGEVDAEAEVDADDDIEGDVVEDEWEGEEEGGRASRRKGPRLDDWREDLDGLEGPYDNTDDADLF